MNRKKAKELLPVIQHIADGGSIEDVEELYSGEPRHFDGTWIFDNEHYSYRIKQEPREFWVKTEGIPETPVLTGGKYDPEYSEDGWIKVREVLE